MVRETSKIQKVRTTMPNRQYAFYTTAAEYTLFSKNGHGRTHSGPKNETEVWPKMRCTESIISTAVTELN